jgi:hypothetical protein
MQMAPIPLGSSSSAASLFLHHPHSGNDRCILSVGRIIPTKTTGTSEAAGCIFQYFGRFGTPDVIHTDQRTRKRRTSSVTKKSCAIYVACFSNSYPWYNVSVTLLRRLPLGSPLPYSSSTTQYVCRIESSYHLVQST